MISCVESRKPTNHHGPSNHPSLPPILEVIRGTKPGPYPPRPPSSIQPGLSLPSPFDPAPRSFSETVNHSSPQLLRTASSSPPRQDALPTFSNSPRPHFINQPSLPPALGGGQRPSAKPEIPLPHHHPEQQKPSGPHHPPNRMYKHPPRPPPALALVAYQPGKMPLPTYPISPRHAVPPHVTGPYGPRAPSYAEEAGCATRIRYDVTFNTHFESWSYPDWLGRIGSSSRTIINFAETYSKIARERYGAHAIPGRLPVEQEVSDMLSNLELIKRSLEQVRDFVQASIQKERARAEARLTVPNEEEHDVPMHKDAVKPQYGMPEAKKRRGRAVLPGRCRSCNRIDTPEWRRGPSGARTLCNACGLH